MIWFFNGKYVSSSLAKIPVCDIAVLRGFGVFDFLVTYNRKPFKLAEHIDRLFASVGLIDLKIPYSKTEMKNFVLESIKRNKGSDFTVRIVVTGGVSSSNLFPEGKSNVAVLVERRVPYPSSCYNSGIKLKTFEYLRPFNGCSRKAQG